ncbi:MAG: dihydrolipoyl dehydrogenase [Planctomycetes bacterium]|nr:dihydrolipoyl dehydrogenase [Planctomycetota bacterium]
MERFDVAVIGSGPGGYVAAIRAAQLGLRAALLEKHRELGGTCLHVGCIPTKALLESSELYWKLGRGLQAHGITTGRTRLSVAALLARKDRVVSELTAGLTLLMKKNRIPVLHGTGAFVAPDRVEVSAEGEVREIEATHVVIATGSAPVALPVLPFDGAIVVSSTDALRFARVPRRLVVVGAGAIGLELGSVWSRLGAKVTVLELLPRIVPFADKRAADALRRALEGQGLEFRLGVRVTGARIGKTGATVLFENDRGEKDSVRANKVLVAVGRRPYTEGLGLERIGVARDEAGRIAVGPDFRTSVPGVFAIGDVVRGPMLAHKAEEEGIAVAEVIAGSPGHVNADAIPSVVYTWPELAEVGLNEEAAKARGLPVKVGRAYFKVNGRARTLGEEEGLVKVVAHAETDRLLGVSIVGPRASDLIAEATVALEFRGSAEDLARTCHAHPTLSEVLREAALAVAQRSIHG